MQCSVNNEINVKTFGICFLSRMEIRRFVQSPIANLLYEKYDESETKR